MVKILLTRSARQPNSLYNCLERQYYCNDDGGLVLCCSTTDDLFHLDHPTHIVVTVSDVPKDGLIEISKASSCQPVIRLNKKPYILTDLAWRWLCDWLAYEQQSVYVSIVPA